ncbi:M23 family metallopeptidase [Persephonella sp.]|uniref:M23 family metallopeptidase n=1 Tax=Persephonella sp. TaxID=2060922 RepID=UPI0025E670C7|nr:M23 family metallopeptidase [Persephonella sp.]
MRDKFTITIHDVNGAKQYTLKQIVKKYILYLIGFIILFFIVSTSVIYFLSKEVMELSQKKEELLKQNVKLLKEKIALKQSINEKTSELRELSEKVKNIEEMIGLIPEEKKDFSKRVKELSLTSGQIYHMFKNIPNGSPLKNTIITSRFGYRKHPVNGQKDFHPGVDLRAKVGTPVFSTANGIVEYAGRKGAYGKMVIIQHNYGFKTIYGHLSKIKVKTGDFVEKGQLIGFSGNTGLINGPHLHYEVRYLQRPLNPVNFIRWKKLSYKEIFKKERHVRWESLIKGITLNLQPLIPEQQ